MTMSLFGMAFEGFRVLARAQARNAVVSPLQVPFAVHYMVVRGFQNDGLMDWRMVQQGDLASRSSLLYWQICVVASHAGSDHEAC